MFSAPHVFHIQSFTIAREGVALLASLGPGSNPDEVVGAFAMIGMGDDARLWRSRIRSYQAASDKAEAKLTEAMLSGASLFDAILAMDVDAVRLLRDEAAERRLAGDEAWHPLGEIVELAKSILPEGDVP